MVKNYDNMLSRFHLIPERHGQTDGQAGRQTDRIAISISRVNVLTYDKNCDPCLSALNVRYPGTTIRALYKYTYLLSCCTL